MILSQIPAWVSPDFLELTGEGGGLGTGCQTQKALSSGIVEHRNRGAVSVLSWALKE